VKIGIVKKMDIPPMAARAGTPRNLCGLGHADTSVPLKVVAYADSKLLADALAKRLGDD
jgi:hypothetical protein